jgi:nucleoside phosphorylase
MTDALLARLTFEPVGVSLTALPWPKGFAPHPVKYNATPLTPLPKADVLIVTWTSAEWMALADVLTPGYHKTTWLRYAENWADFEPHLTWKSPAKEANCLGEYMLTEIGGKRVLCFHSQLHLATDDATAPVVALWKQIIPEVDPGLVITTGTAGGIGTGTALGDVFVVSNAKFNCTKVFKDQEWAQERFTSVMAGSYQLNGAAQSLMAVNAPKLRPVATRDPLLVTGGDVETVDYFGFDDTDDSYHIVENDEQAHTEEMDDATLWLALQELGITTPALSIRNASDPEVPSSIGTLEQQSKYASEIYTRYGYYTTIGSAIACWAVIAGL